MDDADFCPKPNDYPDNTPVDFQLSDYLMLEDCFFEKHDQHMTMFDKPSPENISSSSSLLPSDDQPPSTPTNIKCKSGNMKREGLRIAFRTKSKLDIMDDGFKWRKYGKKMVKNSPNPRNYFKCSSGECNVKKRVERDREDARFVITTYEGVHNHESPTLLYHSSPISSARPNVWNLQDSVSL